MIMWRWGLATFALGGYASHFHALTWCIYRKDSYVHFISFHHLSRCFFRTPLRPARLSAYHLNCSRRRSCSIIEMNGLISTPSRRQIIIISQVNPQTLIITNQPRAQIWSLNTRYTPLQRITTPIECPKSILRRIKIHTQLHRCSRVLNYVAVEKVRGVYHLD